MNLHAVCTCDEPIHGVYVCDERTDRARYYAKPQVGIKQWQCVGLLGFLSFVYHPSLKDQFRTQPYTYEKEALEREVWQT
jgi:hypothetical protein